MRMNDSIWNKTNNWYVNYGLLDLLYLPVEQWKVLRQDTHSYIGLVCSDMAKTVTKSNALF